MQKIIDSLMRVLKKRERDLVELYEFYSPDETDFVPEKATFRFAKSPIMALGSKYERRVLSRTRIRRNISKQANTVSVTLSNADAFMAKTVNTFRLEGMWAQVRIYSPSAQAAMTIFGGRVEKPSALDRKVCRLSIKQDFGGSEEEFPSRKMTRDCNVEFKGEACRGGLPISAHSAAYQAAPRCSKAFNFCTELGNEDNYGGVRFATISGTFQYTVTETKRFLIFFKKKKSRTVSASWSSVSDLEESTVVPEVYGVTQVAAIPLMHADTGANLNFLSVLCEGEIEAIFDVKCRDKKYSPVISNYQAALGKYGSQGQPSSALFSGSGKFSGMAWIEGSLLGSDPSDANDESPTITAVVKGRVIDLPNPLDNFSFTNRGWSDCGPYIVRHMLINRGKLHPSQIDDDACLEAALKTFEPVLDDTGVEQAIVPNTLTPGIDFRLYAALSGFGAATIDKIALMMAQGKHITGGYGQLVDAYYRYINQQQPPQFIAPIRKVRRRYTTNFVTDEESKLSDFIWDVVLPSFNGRLIYSAAGKVQIKVGGPADSTYIRDSVDVGATEIAVEDVTQWALNREGMILIGAHQPTAEIKRVTGFRYSTIGNTIPLSVLTTGTLTASTSGANLSGANDNMPASATITLGGSITAGSTITISIDGIASQYTVQAGDDVEALAGYMAAMINANPTLRRYVKAEWNDSNDSVIRIVSKIGFVKLDAPLEAFHANLEETIRIQGAFGGENQLKYRDDSFSWPLGDRQSSVNRVEGKYRAIVNDWASTLIWRNAEAHQAQVRRTSKQEINLSAIDSAHQAARVLKIALGKLRTCDWFCSFTTSAEALVFDIDDVICVSHFSGGGYIKNVPVVIEEIEVDDKHNISIIARLYKSEIHDDTINEMTPTILMPLQTGSANNTDTPPPNQPSDTPPTGSSGTGGNPPEPPYSGGSGGYGSGGGNYDPYWDSYFGF